MKPSRCIPFVFALMVGMFALITSAGAAPKKPGGTILFADETGFVHTINADMTNDQLVGTGTVNDTAFRPGQFSLSPDATTIAFGGCTCAAGLATVRTDG